MAYLRGGGSSWPPQSWEKICLHAFYNNVGIGKITVDVNLSLSDNIRQKTKQRISRSHFWHWHWHCAFPLLSLSPHHLPNPPAPYRFSSRFILPHCRWLLDLLTEGLLGRIDPNNNNNKAFNAIESEDTEALIKYVYLIMDVPLWSLFTKNENGEPLFVVNKTGVMHKTIPITKVTPNRTDISGRITSWHQKVIRPVI